MPPLPAAKTPPAGKPVEERLASLDAYRGFVMICLAAGGFGIAAAAKNFPLTMSAEFQRLAFYFEHVPWVGCSFWDLIQPSFMFMVGVSMAYSYAKRKKLGHSWGRMALHAGIRSIVLILLGIALSSNSSSSTNFTFVNVLTQIGLGYFFLFLLWDRPRWVQVIASVVVLVGYWSWFALTPLPPPDFNLATVGVEPGWHRMQGFNAHWEKGTNPAAKFDVWFLNRFRQPDGKPFEFNKGGYATLNFIPSLVTMLLGLMTGEIIRTTPGRLRVLGVLIAGGMLLLGAGWGLGELGVCPVVKRIWTPSWVLYSAGWTLLLLAPFYAVMDGLGLKWLGYPLMVAGANSILLYVMGQTLGGWTSRTLVTHFGKDLFELYGLVGSEYAPIVQSCSVLLVFWLFVFWLYRQRIFVRI